MRSALKPFLLVEDEEVDCTGVYLPTVAKIYDFAAL